MAGALFAWLFVAPIFLYGVAALSHMIARLFGGQGSFYLARVALFWALLAATPCFLLSGLVTGFAAGVGAQIGVGVVTAGVFLGFWLSGLWAVEWGAAVAPAAAKH